MKVAQINMVSYGSTGKIMLQIAEVARNAGHDARTYATEPFQRKRVVVSNNIPEHYIWGSYFENMLHYYIGSTLGKNGFYSKRGTKWLLRELDKFAPDVVHLHNLHSHCINFPMLFHFLKEKNVKVIWTLHDCWAFTGQCPYFDMVGCEKWKTGCHHCPQIISYPKTRIDNSKNMYWQKKQWFTGIKDMTIVTPSRWLADLVQQSFLKEYPVKVINNGIDLSVFKPRESDFRVKNNCEDKFIILGVAFGWGKRKGLDVFIELAQRLDKHYQIVLVGTDEITEKQLPENIITIRQTHNQQELAQIYSAADLFVNPTREEVMGLVNVEALACGTPVITFQTGGSPACIDETCGIVVEKNNVDEMERMIYQIFLNRPFSKQACVKKAQDFDKNLKMKEYVQLYEDCTYSTPGAL